MKKIVIPCIIALGTSACTTTTALTEQEIISRYQPVAELQQSVAMAEASNLQMLSPMQYSKAQQALEESMEMARYGRSEAVEIAQQGIAALNSAKGNAEKSKDMLDKVLMARDLSEKAGAQSLIPEKYQAAEEDLKILTQAIEKGRYEKVRESRDALAKTYRNLELMAMKQDIVESAQKALSEAEAMNADRDAPKTFQQAKQEMDLALNILEVNRGDKQEAENYAARARWWAQRAMAVAEVVQTFRQGDFSNEDSVLWYQDQLSSVVMPVNDALPLNYQHKRLMSSIRSDLENVIMNNQKLIAENKQLMEQSETLVDAGRAQQQAMETKLHQTKQQAEEADRKFEFIQSLFDEKEAIVFRQRNEVLLRTQGFDFPSGKSEIDSKNFALLQKIIRAIDEYPSAKIAVIGHTDSVGSAEINQRLSEARAQKVADFLIQVGQIEPSRVSFKGYGEARPIASNESQAGRAENRRVEIKLMQ